MIFGLVAAASRIILIRYRFIKIVLLGIRSDDGLVLGDIHVIATDFALPAVELGTYGKGQ